ncbi:unnamed protein product [Gadus morhua 'NCC']
MWTRAEVNTRARVKMTVGITAWHHYKSVGWRSSFAFREEAAKVKSALVGTTQLVLVEGASKRSAQDLCGRSDGNVKVIFLREGRDSSLDSGI